MSYTVDFHTHTYHSYDSRMQPARILELAVQKGLDAIIINDHDTIKGGLECAAINKHANLKVIVGAEIKTDIGDITGIYLKQEIQARHYADVLQEIKNQGGLSILNHPYYHHKLDDMNFDGIDLIEGYNGRLSAELNNKAIALAHKLNKPIIAGSDAHTYGEVGNCKTQFDSLDNLMLPLDSVYKQCPVMALPQSQLIKIIKRKNYAGLYGWAKWSTKYIYRRTISGRL